MYLLAFLNGTFIRALSVNSENLENTKETIRKDFLSNDVTFDIKTQEEFEEWEQSLPKPPPQPTVEDFNLEMDYRITMLEMMGGI